MLSTTFSEEKQYDITDEVETKNKPRPPGGPPPRRITNPSHVQQSSRFLPDSDFDFEAESKLNSPLKGDQRRMENKFEHSDKISNTGVQARGVLGVSTGARAKILQSQREAALRRRTCRCARVC